MSHTIVHLSFDSIANSPPKWKRPTAFRRRSSASPVEPPALRACALVAASWNDILIGSRPLPVSFDPLSPSSAPWTLDCADEDLAKAVSRLAQPGPLFAFRLLEQAAGSGRAKAADAHLLAVVLSVAVKMLHKDAGDMMAALSRTIGEHDASQFVSGSTYDRLVDAFVPTLKERMEATEATTEAWRSALAYLRWFVTKPKLERADECVLM